MKYLLIASWIFLPSTFTHYGGQRVHQYSRPIVEALPDPRNTTYYYSYRHIHDGFGGHTTIIVRPR